jgi:rod shape determining protein RodA
MFNSKFWYNFDYVSLVLVISLAVFGIVSLAGATGESDARWVKQLFFFIFGLICCIGIVFVDYRTLTRYAPLLYIGGIITLVIVFVPQLGHKTHGAQSWIKPKGLPFQVQVQPAEFAKLTTIIMLAKVLGSRKERWNGLWDMMRPLIIGVIPTIFILAQPDLGSAVVFGPITLLMMFAAGMPISFFLLLFSPFLAILGISHDPVLMLIWIGVLGFLLIYAISRHTSWTVWLPFILLSIASYMVVYSQGEKIWEKFPTNAKTRLMTYFDPDSVSTANAWNINQSKIALGSGGFWGIGLGKGTQSRYGFLPESEHDFVFPSVGEQLGFVGGITLLFLFFLLMMRGLETAVSSKTLQGSLIATGIVSLFFSHITINIGMVTGLLPVTGLPLTFISYGGSFMLASMVSVGLLINIHYRSATEMIEDGFMKNRSQMALPSKIDDNDIWG